MGLSPEERKRIYEEEKARIEGEKRKREDEGKATTGLKPNIAALLCYVGAWISGIIFLIIEQKNRFVRFHAVQSIITFGLLSVASGLLGWMPVLGGFFQAVIGIVGFITWIVSMVKAYNGELFKIPIAGDLADSIIPVSGIRNSDLHDEPAPADPPAPAASVPEQDGAPEVQPVVSPIDTDRMKNMGRNLDAYLTGSHAGRITASALTIAWSAILLIFFSFFSRYIALYEPVYVNGRRMWYQTPLITDDYYTWLPILITTLVLTIGGHIIMIIYDKYWLRQTIHIILNIMSVVTVVMLVSIFPFDFSVLPGTNVESIVTVSVTIALIAVAIGISIGTLVMFIKVIVNVARSAIE